LLPLLVSVLAASVNFLSASSSSTTTTTTSPTSGTRLETGSRSASAVDEESLLAVGRTSAGSLAAVTGCWRRSSSPELSSLGPETIT
jgi:hypothetical protein